MKTAQPHLTYHVKKWSSLHTPTSKHYFFIQSHGLHAGRPLKTSIPNCFILTAQTKEEKDALFTIAEGLFSIRFFECYLVGSVIPFLRINDLKNTLNQGFIQAQQSPEQLLKATQVSQLTEKTINQLTNQIEQLSQLKQLHFLRLFKR